MAEDRDEGRHDSYTLHNQTWTTNKRKELENHLTNDNKKSDEKYKVPIYSDEAPEPLQVFHVPTEILSYNFDNIRISAEKAKIEADRNRRKLDPADPEDQKIVEDILYESKLYSSNATEYIQEDIERRGQIDPAIVTVDGVVWNGNRRLAVRRRLHKLTGAQKYSRIDIVVLPELSKKELKKLERRLQMHRDFRESYGPIQLRLDVRNALTDSEWEENEIIASYGNQYTITELRTFNAEIDLIDDYLCRIKKVNDYVWLSQENGQGVESFTILNSILRKMYKQNAPAMEIEKTRLIGFRLINHEGTTYGTMRHLQAVLGNRQADAELKKKSPAFNKFPKRTNHFDEHAVNAEYENVELAYETVISSRKDAKTLADRALVILQSIKNDRIPKNNPAYMNTLQELADVICRLKSQAG